MLYYLSQHLLEAYDGTEMGDLLSPLRVFRYVSFRSAGAAVTALLLSLWLGPKFIRWLTRLEIRQHYRDAAEAGGDLTVRNGDKRGTPTMGGLLIVTVIDLTALLWAHWNPLVILALVSLVGLAALGFYDDYAKITEQTSEGVRGRIKLAVQILLALGITLYLWRVPETNRLITDIMVPFCKYPVLTGATFTGMLLSSLTIVGSSNAVNLTDGLDGLAIGLVLIVAGVFLVLTYVADHAIFADYLRVSRVRGASELTVLCAGLCGAALGFLWFNCHPAQVFMGDTGSLSLGGVLGVIAVLIHQPFVLMIAGGVFVWEALSVILQVGCYRYHMRFHRRDRRIFLKTPIHHHYEKLGWPETRIVTRFYIMGLLCAVVALATLKIR